MAGATGCVVGLCMVLATACMRTSAPETEGGDQQPLPEPIAGLLDEGDPAAALRALSMQWVNGGDAGAIEAVRERALAALAAAGSFTIGEETFQLREVRAVYEWMLQQPDVLHSRVVVAGDLPPDRFLVLAVVAGGAHTEPAREGAAYVLPDIDLDAALASPDPWLVSAALFMARKQDVALELSELLARWQDGQPWDTACTEQALLYLARWPRADLERAAEGAGLPAAVTELAVPDPAAVVLEPWLFLSSGEWSPDLVVLERGAGLTLELRDSTMEVIGERPLGGPDPALELPATGNYYSLRYLDGAMHGESRSVDSIAGGTYVRLAAAVLGGV